jgi:hypothetical protein
VLFKLLYSSLKITNKKKVNKLILFTKMKKTFHSLQTLNKFFLNHKLLIYRRNKKRLIKIEIIKYKKNYITLLNTKIIEFFQIEIQKIDLMNILNRLK